MLGRRAHCSLGFLQDSSLLLLSQSTAENPLFHNLKRFSLQRRRICERDCTGWFCVNLTQAGVITEKGASGEERPK